MAYNPNTPNTPKPSTTYNTTQTTPPARSGSTIAFIVGGLVVLVAVIGYFVFIQPTRTNNTSIRIETPAAAQPAPAVSTAPATGTLPAAPAEGTGTTGTAVPGN